MPRVPRHTELPLAVLATLATRAAAWMSGADETFDHRGADADPSTCAAATPKTRLGSLVALLAPGEMKQVLSSAVIAR